MTRNDMVASQYLGSLEKLIELHEPVTVDARIRSKAVFIGIDELVYDLFLEAVLEIEDIELHSEFKCNISCIFDIIQCAAGVRIFLYNARIIMKFHGAPDTLISRLLRKICSYT